MIKTTLQKAFFILSLIIATFAISVTEVKAQTLNIAPTSASCGDQVVFTGSNLDQNTSYELIIVCSLGTGGCAGQSFTLGSFLGQTTNSLTTSFNVDNTCAGGSIAAGSGVFRTFLRWTDTGGNDLAIGGPDLTLTPLVGSCSLNQTVVPQINQQGLLDLENGNPNTSYTFTINNAGCTISASTFTLNDGSSPGIQAVCTTAGTYTVTATSSDPLSPRNCSTDFSVLNSSGLPAGCGYYTSGCPSGLVECPNNTLVCCPSTVECLAVPNYNATPSHRAINLAFCDATGNPTDAISDRIYTAIGCIPANGISPFLIFIVPWSIGVGGGLAFLLIIYAGFLISTAAGNPGQVRAGQELLAAAIAGLLMVILSVFLVRFIGQDILQIPGL